MNARESETRDAAVLVVDVAGSTDIADFEARRDRILASVSHRHAATRAISRPYTVTAWDEFQSVADDVSGVPGIVLDLRLAFAPLQLYAGIGFGPVSGWRSDKPMNEALHGPAFERAREAIDAVKAGGGKYPRLTAFRTGAGDRDAALNLVYRLHDTLIQQISPRQWETMAAASEADSQEALARRFQVEPSTITRNLRRGHYWQLRDTALILGEQLASGPLALN